MNPSVWLVMAGLLMPLTEPVIDDLGQPDTTVLPQPGVVFMFPEERYLDRAQCMRAAIAMTERWVGTVTCYERVAIDGR